MNFIWLTGSRLGAIALKGSWYAKRINDSDLILYALTQEIKQVREDGNLSGKDRESKLNTLESSIRNTGIVEVSY